MTDAVLLDPVETTEAGRLPDPDLDNANTCIRCKHWGAERPPAGHDPDNDRWRWCSMPPVPARAHRNFTCDAHERISKSAALARLTNEETAP